MLQIYTVEMQGKYMSVSIMAYRYILTMLIRYSYNKRWMNLVASAYFSLCPPIAALSLFDCSLAYHVPEKS